MEIEKAQELLQKKYPASKYFLVELIIWRDGSGAKIELNDDGYNKSILFEGSLNELTKHLEEE